MKLTLDLAHRLLGRDQEAQYRAAVRLRNDGEHRFHSLIYSTGHMRVKVCKGPPAQATVSVGVRGCMMSELKKMRDAALASG